ncbi:hypothetical protein B1C78_14685 [Thioalkalivibrio denitrificans]|uniref:Tyr recombinase domain-containing protein n=1 Tax=Thioalkalivibrio denitrificans TaxID=108003 RepID=A0A1V3NC66_9GAMM|nr:tyrosine-type recombinase/integrase [Thioalkalivibrio denitrificans]OOG22670.1 hypothetical protein B1C78_14685 [Thioalkalivibrio denitrificans]
MLLEWVLKRETHTVAKYLTYEKRRERWVFQMRIPPNVRTEFDGKTTIRRHIGNVSYDDAVARATLWSTELKELFCKIAHTQNASNRTKSATWSVVHFEFNDDIAQRLIATWRTTQARMVTMQIEALRGTSDHAWQELATRFHAHMTEAQDQMRQYDSGVVHAALRRLEREYAFRLSRSTTDLNRWAADFHFARVQFFSDCIKVLRQEMSINELAPRPTLQLPLADLWGTPVEQLTDTWVEHRSTDGIPINLKTLQKYAAIASDLSSVITRRAVESLQQADLIALKRKWALNGNGAGTINGKLQMLKTLLRPYLASDRISVLFDRCRVKAPRKRVARLPFTDSQLRRLIEAVNQSPQTRIADRVLIYMLLLLGTRVEEIYQLTAKDVETVEYGWIIRFADNAQTGQGDSELKNDESARRMPLLRGIFPEMDAWIDSHRSSEYLFPDGSANKYGKRGDAAGKRINGLVRKLFPDDRRLVLQSTRNTAGQVLRRGHVDPRIRQRFLGHADSSLHDKHYDPGALLDSDDFWSGSVAIACHLMRVMGVERLPWVDLHVHYNANIAQDRSDMLKESLWARTKKEAALDMQESEIESPAQLCLEPPPY